MNSFYSEVTQMTYSPLHPPDFDYYNNNPHELRQIEERLQLKFECIRAVEVSVPEGQIGFRVDCTLKYGFRFPIGPVRLEYYSPYQMHCVREHCFLALTQQAAINFLKNAVRCECEECAQGVIREKLQFDDFSNVLF